MIVPVLLLLTGCGAQQTLETVSDVYAQPVSVEAQQMVLSLPADAQVPTMENGEAGTLYLCDGYTITVQTAQSGDLNKTLQEVTGFSRDELKLVESVKGDAKRYDCVWTAAGEEQTQVGRACVLDDGNYHYVVAVMAGESEAGELREVWQELFDSFRLVPADSEINIGS